MATLSKQNGSYQILPGDTLSKIASTGGVTLEQLLASNPQYKTNPNLIMPGQTVNLGPSYANLTSANSSALSPGQFGGAATPTINTSSPQTNTNPNYSANTNQNTNSTPTYSSLTQNNPTQTQPQQNSPDTTNAYAKAILNMLQASQQGLNSVNTDYLSAKGKLLTGQQNATNAGLNLGTQIMNNPQYAANGIQTGALASGADQAFNPGVLSADKQLNMLGSAYEAQGNIYKNASSNALDLLKLQQPISTGYYGLYDPTTKQTIGGIGGTGGGGLDAISTAIQEGRLTTDMIGRYSAPYVQAVLKADPGYNFVTSQAGKNFITNTDTQKFLTNARVANSTVGTLTDLVKKVPGGDLALVNKTLLELGLATSNQDVATFFTANGILADELGKILGSAQGSDFAIKLGQSLMNPNLSTDAKMAQIQYIQERIANKISEYNATGNQGNQSSSTTGSSTGYKNGGAF